MTPLSRRQFLQATFGFLAAALLVPKGRAQGLGQGTRTVEGRVYDPAGKPRPNAIVYLRDEKSREIKTYITTADGNYRFTLLSMNVNYQLWSKYQNMQSKTRSISSFSSKPTFVFDLKLEPSK
jgi:hypothetical protein